MKSFRSGKFDRGQAPRALQKLCPDQAFDQLTDIRPADLTALGFKVVLLDVDNTLLPWRDHTVPESSLAWIQEARSAGLQLCLVSNTRNLDRLGKLAEQMGIDHLKGKFKPSRDMYQQAAQKYGVEPQQMVMVGDQILTDILGANRSGVTAYLVRRMSDREFFGTRANRIIESIVRPSLYRAMIDEDDDLPIVAPVGLFQRRIVRQILKFGIVGGSSFLIDAGLHKILMFYVQIEGQPVSQVFGRWILGGSATVDAAHDAAFLGFKILTSSLAILNSFYWNRRWTWGIRGKEERGQQLARFIVVSLIGQALNTIISSMINAMAKGTQEGNWWLATLVAAGLVAIWNFTGQRLWAFRRGTAK